MNQNFNSSEFERKFMSEKKITCITVGVENKCLPMESRVTENKIYLSA